MGLFGKKENKEFIPKLPELPKLPNLPTNFKSDYELYNDQIPLKEFPSMENYTKEIHELPSFPTNSFSDKFSQNSIKSAIKGNDYEEDFGESLDYEMEELPKKPKIEFKKIMPPKEIVFLKKPIHEEKTKVIQEEPIFIRIDKFEESLKIFNKVKEKITEIEHLLNETKEIKEKENQELSNWEEEVQKLKHNIEKVDKDIFSKIE